MNRIKPYMMSVLKSLRGKTSAVEAACRPMLKSFALNGTKDRWVAVTEKGAVIHISVETSMMEIILNIKGVVDAEDSYKPRIKAANLNRAASYQPDLFA